MLQGKSILAFRSVGGSTSALHFPNRKQLSDSLLKQVSNGAMALGMPT
jgi:hypothetical protein